MPKEAKLYCRENGYYFIHYYDEFNERKKISTGTKNRLDATIALNNFIKSLRFSPPKNNDLPDIEIHHQIRQSRVNSVENHEYENITFSELTQRFLNAMESIHTPKTREAYLSTFRHFKIYYDNNISGIKKSLIAHYLDGRKKQSISSARKDRINLHSLFNFAVEREWMSENPVTGIKTIKLPQRLPLFFTDSNIESICALADDDLRDIVIFALNTGLRQGELIELNWNNINFQKKKVILDNQAHITKSKKVRSIPLNSKALEVLSNRSKSSNYVFALSGKKWKEQTLSKKFKKTLRELRLDEKLNFHSTRHTFASMLAQKGVPLIVIKELLGHADLKTTMIYSHLSDENLSKSVELL